MTIEKLRKEAVLLILAFALLVFATQRAEASGDRITQSNDMNNQTAGDIVTGGMSSGNTIALSGGNLGDVDISGCWGSTQFSVFVFFARQTLKLDPLCVAREYDKAGHHTQAAELRCQVKEIAKLDYTGTTCIEANKFHVEHPAEILSAAPAPRPAARPVSRTQPAAMLSAQPAACCLDEDEHDDEHRRKVDETAAALAELKAELAREKRNRQAYARQAQAADDAERAYAQQVLDELRSIDEPTEEPSQ